MSLSGSWTYTAPVAAPSARPTQVVPERGIPARRIRAMPLLGVAQGPEVLLDLGGLLAREVLDLRRDEAGVLGGHPVVELLQDFRKDGLDALHLGQPEWLVQREDPLEPGASPVG